MPKKNEGKEEKKKRYYSKERVMEGSERKALGWLFLIIGVLWLATIVRWITFVDERIWLPLLIALIGLWKITK